MIWPCSKKSPLTVGIFVTDADLCGCKDRVRSQEVRSSSRGRPLYLPNKGTMGGCPYQIPDYTLFSHKINVPTRLRVTFSKTGDMRYLSHNELMTVMFRALRRAQIPVAYSAGFHPHPTISFGPALAVGVEGLKEYFDVELTALIGIRIFPKC